MSGWDAEYIESGVPSSIRDDPSGVVVWFVRNWQQLAGTEAPRRGLDVGCGTARNTVFLARWGARMTGLDSSGVAIEKARERVAAAGMDIALFQHDLRDGLPAGDGELDFVADVFVYKHQLHPAERQRYREEMGRVLAPDGRVLVSLAERGDGYYSGCPEWPDPEAGPRAVLDPVVGVGSVLFSLEELTAEMGDRFELEMAWRKEKRGEMHGASYLRRTLATIWRPRDDV